MTDLETSTANHEHIEPAAASAPPKDSLRTDLLSALSWSFLLLAILPLLFYQIEGPHQDFIAEIARVFLSVVLEALPFVLLGSLIGGLIEVFVSSEGISRVLAGRSARAALLAGGLGLVFPVCECAIVPVVRRLTRKGVPLAAAVTFLLAGPIVNPLVAASTFVAYRFDWRIAAARVIMGYVIAVTLGLLLGRLFRNRPAMLGSATSDHGHTQRHAGCGCESGHAHGPGLSVYGRIVAALRHAADDFVDIGRFLVIGAFVAACMRAAISQGQLFAVAGNQTFAIPVMMVMAFVLTLCSEADAFVAASFGRAVPMSAQMAFLLLGPMLDIKLAMMFFGLFRKRFAAALICGIVAAVLAASMVYRFIV